MRNISLIGILAIGFATACGAGEWKQAQGPLKTKWAAEVTPQNALPEYPRPQMVRKDWLSLNGVWQFEAAAKQAERRPMSEVGPGKETDPAPTGNKLSEQILVPYPEESALSGIMRHEDRAWYRRTFDVPSAWAGRDVLLHFDAVNWEATVYLNGKRLGQHKGGYDAFGFNITKFLKKSGPQELIVEVVDTPDLGNHARGKQTMHPGGIFYTAASGIWQSVWIEPVATTFIENIKAVPNVDGGAVSVTVRTLGKLRRANVKIDVSAGGKSVGSATGRSGRPIKIKVPDAHLWSPDDPFLYDMTVAVQDPDGSAGDSVASYFGMRKIALGKDDKGILRPMLNGKFVFQVGPLDQGYWPDGIYTAPTDAALKYDIEIEKKLGFNTVRKHVKVEPERWYYWCDKLGMLVWQDMPSMRETPAKDAARVTDGELKKLKDQVAAGKLTADQLAAQTQLLNGEKGRLILEERNQFEHELDRLLEGRGNHPCIIQWVVFNEGWGQYDTDRLVGHVKDLDPTRLVDNASGWTDMKVGDVVDMHHYPDPAMPKTEADRASELGEFGGLGLPLPGHTWVKSDKNWGYRKIANQDQLTAGYEAMLAKAWHLKDQGLCAVIYTQTTDVETECNGLLTYDRAVVKPNVDRLHAVNTGHLENVPQPHVLAPSAQENTKIAWRYSTQPPAQDWNKPGFDDSAWKQGFGGFGTAGTPGAIVGTNWNTNDIWLRRAFALPDEQLRDPRLVLHHDDEAEVYLNGVLASKQDGYLGEYQVFALSPEARSALKPGENLIAIHCHQHTGGQFIDAGIVDMRAGATASASPEASTLAAEPPTPARNAASQQISAALLPFVNDHTLAGAVTLVASRDQVLAISLVGDADLATHTPMRENDLFWIASMSKPMTAAALMMLVDEGKVNVDDPVEKYLPEFRGQMVAVEQDADHVLLKNPVHPITVKNILSHTSGLPFMSRVEHHIDQLPLRQAVMSYALSPLTFQPDSKWSYANAGLNTAGRIIEVVSGMPYERFMQQRLFDPLGMKDTTFWPTREQLSRLAKSYHPDASHQLTEIEIDQLTYPLDSHTRYPCPAGGLFSSARDVAAFGQMILNGGTFHGKRLLSEASVRQMTSTQTGDLLNHGKGESGYGFGFSTTRRGQGPGPAPAGACGHGGAYATDLWIDPDHQLVMVYMVQHAGYGTSEGGRIVPTFHQVATQALGK